MDFVVPLEQVTIAVEGTEHRFPVRRIYCVGRNYLDHIRETAGADEREPPFFFQKPADAVNPANRKPGVGALDGDGDLFQGNDEAHVLSLRFFLGVKISFHSIMRSAVSRHNIRY